MGQRQKYRVPDQRFGHGGLRYRAFLAKRQSSTRPLTASWIWEQRQDKAGLRGSAACAPRGSGVRRSEHSCRLPSTYSARYL